MMTDAWAAEGSLLIYSSGSTTSPGPGLVIEQEPDQPALHGIAWRNASRPTG